MSYTKDSVVGSLQDTAVFSAYSTVATVSVFGARQLVKFASSTLGAPKVNFWYCNDEVGNHAWTAATQEALAQGVALNGLRIEPGANSMSPSDVPEAWGSLVSAAAGITTHVLAEMGEGDYY